MGFVETEVERMDRETPGKPGVPSQAEGHRHGAGGDQAGRGELSRGEPGRGEPGLAATSQASPSPADEVKKAESEVAAAGVAVAGSRAGSRPESLGSLRRSASLLGPRGIVAASLLVVALFLGSFGVTYFVGSQAHNAPGAGSPATGDDPGAGSGSGGLGWGSGAETGFGSHTNGDVPDGGFSNGGQSDGAADSGVWSGPQQPADPNGPLLAIVIDDWGYGWQAAADFLAFDRPLTVAVLPYLPLSKAQANEAHARGHQVILHLPMEPLGEGWDLGEGAVTTSKTSEQIEVDVRAALMAVPHVTGVNNHMGSKATVDERVVTDVLSVVKEHGLFFLDSRTNADSVVPLVAQRLGMPYLENDRFIDPDPDPQRVKERILLAARLAKRRGYAIAIGHVRPETYQGLIASLPELDQEGVRLAYLWEILERVTPDVPQLLDAVDTGNDDTPHTRETQGTSEIAETGGSAGPDAAKLASPGAGVDPAIDDVPDPYDVTY